MGQVLVVAGKDRNNFFISCRLPLLREKEKILGASFSIN